MSATKRLCICAICTALCYVLPLAFHPLTLGSALSPMHIPVLLCGLLCGWSYGLFCGIIGPILSSLLSGMPPMAMLITMIPELCIYGVVCGVLMRFLHTGRLYTDLYFSMVPSMIAGRIIGGVAKALFYMATAQPYSIALWASSYFVATLPGAVLQLILLPAIVLVLTKAKLIPDRYPTTQKEC